MRVNNVDIMDWLVAQSPTCTDLWNDWMYQEVEEHRWIELRYEYETLCWYEW